MNKIFCFAIPAAASLLLVTGSPARACTWAECSDSYAAPSNDLIPVNAPALVFRPPSSTSAAQPIAAKLGLFTLDGAPLPFELETDPAAPGHLLVRPSAPLAVGAGYRLVNFSTCGSSTAQGAFNQGFHAEAARPLPTTLGTVEVSPSREATVHVTGGGLCVEPVKGEVARIDISPSPELRAYRALTRWTLKVNGKVEAVSPYGGFSDVYLADGIRRVNFPYVVCRPGMGDHAPWLPVGTHQGELSVHIAGATEDPPPVRFTFQLDCDPDPSAPATTPTTSADAGAPLVGPSHQPSGCNVSPSGSGWGAGALSLVAVGTLLLRRRRR